MENRTAVGIGLAILAVVALIAWQALLPRYVVEGDGVRDRWTQEFCPMTEIAADVLRENPSEANAARCPSGKSLVTRGDGKWFAVD